MKPQMLYTATIVGKLVKVTYTFQVTYDGLTIIPLRLDSERHIIYLKR